MIGTNDDEPPAITLLREAAARFREYEASHRAKTDELVRRRETAAALHARARAERNAEIAGRIEAFLAYRASMMAPPEPKPEGRQEI